ncbi:MAG: hypothetical protein ACRDG7_03595 [Candidatus Limnocylindria bacterium]
MPTFRDLKTYLERDGDWEEIPNLARGRRRVGDHWRFRKTLSDGSVLRTKVSHALGDEIGPDLLGHIVRDQLQTTMTHFRDVVAGRATKRAAARPRVEAVPGWLVTRLIHTAGIPEQEVRRMSAEEARSRWGQFIRGEG